MKRIVATILTMMLLGSVAFGEGIDWKSMTDEEITAIIEAGQAELDSRNNGETAPTGIEGFTLIDSDGIKCYLTGDYSTSGGKEDGSFWIHLAAIVENNSSTQISTSIDSISVNGWEVRGYSVSDIGAGKKRKGEIDIVCEDIDVWTLDDVQEIELSMHVSDDNFNRIWTGDPIKLPAIK